MMKSPQSLVVLLSAVLLTMPACQKSVNDFPDNSSKLPEISKYGVIDHFASIAPLRIEAENYSTMSGVMKETCREGGQNIGYISTGDWMEYTVNVPASGSHTINFRVAGPGGTAKVQNANGTILATVSWSATASGQIYTTASGQIMLTAGSQKLRVYAATALWNFNWFELVNNASGDQSAETGSGSTVDGSHLLLESTFEDAGSFTKWAAEICRSSALTISNGVTARKGNYSARFELTKNDVLVYDGYTRAEIRQKSEATRERWYGFSNFLPSDFISDPVPEKIAQWHDVPDFALGENWRSPPISFGIENDRYYLNIIWASSAVNTILTKSGEKRIDLGPVERSKWNDWVFHIKYSYGSDGILEVWKNRTRMVSYYGPNSYNDQVLPYFKIGIYKWGWDGWASYSPASKRVIYYDEVRIGNEQANVPEVSPR